MSRPGSLPLLGALSLIAVGLVTVAPASAQSVKLSGSFPDSADVTSFRIVLALGVSLDLGDELEIAASDRRLVYLSTSDASGARELFGLPLDGSHPPRRLSGDLVAGGDVTRRAVYLADQEVDERIELYASRIDRTAAAASQDALEGTPSRIQATERRVSTGPGEGSLNPGKPGSEAMTASARRERPD